MEKTIVCVYGKGNNVSEVFARLSCLHKRSEGKKYIYCAVIDLPDWISYRSSVDFEIEEKAGKFARYYGKKLGYGFFCAVRQRRYSISGKERIYCCEEGSLGAIKSLWRFVCGRRDEFFPVYGNADDALLRQTERIYYSAVFGESAEQTSFEEIIEQSGIDKLERECGSGAVIPCRTATETVADGETVKYEFLKKTENKRKGLEILFSHAALDKLLSSGISEGDIEVKESECVATERVIKKVYLPKKCRCKVIKKFPK